MQPPFRAALDPVAIYGVDRSRLDYLSAGDASSINRTVSSENRATLFKAAQSWMLRYTRNHFDEDFNVTALKL